MPLAPDRVALSEQYRRDPLPRPAPPPSGPRKCSSCGVVDQAYPLEGEYTAAGEKVVEHLVVPEIRWIKSEASITRHQKSKGWSYKLHQGRPAMVRMSCRPCIRENAIMQLDVERKKAQDRGHGGKNHESWYQDVCGE